MNGISKAITTYAVGEKANSEAFGPLREQAFEYKMQFDGEQAVDEFLHSCSAAEEDFMVTNYSADSNAKTKAGKWKYRTYLPKAYSSAKSVLKNALELDVAIGEAGKSQIEREIKARKAENDEADEDKDWFGVAERHFANLMQALNKLADGDALQADVTARQYADKLNGGSYV